MKHYSMIGSALLLAGLLTACSSSGSSQTSTTPTSVPSTTTTASTTSPSTPAPTTSAASSSASSQMAGMAMITIKNFGFTVSGHIAPGQKIMVHNEDSEAHTVTADVGNAFNVMVPSSATVTLTAPTKPGPYKFHCNYHSNMHGTLTVA